MRTAKLDYSSLLKDAIQKVDMMQAELDKTRRLQNDPIAIVGMACHFPGADTPEAFWQLLQRGADMVQEVPKGRWSIDDYYAPEPGLPGKTYVRNAAFVDHVDHFDPLFFGISPNEAISMDPQQRFLLEVSWEALERAGQAPQKLRGSQTGVFVGTGQVDYAQRTFLNRSPEQIDIYAGTGNTQSVASGRLSYILGVHGPNMAVDTACSASLVAVHLACQSLRLGECTLALAGGVQLMLSPLSTVGLSQMQALSPDGRCKTFDASADGYGRGEGCGVVVLKRLSDAQQDGDRILAVIRGSAVNHDGPSSGLTVPSRTAQEALIRSALKNAQVEPCEVTYIEAHGTGTALGDPIELRALDTVFGKEREIPLWVGSVKTNIGHLEAAAGIAGLMKVVLALQHGEIPPHLHLQEPTSHVDWAKMPIRIPTTHTPWPHAADTAPRVAGVSSFGLSGTNAHIVLASAPPVPSAQTNDAVVLAPERPWQILTLSAKSEQALSTLAERYQEHLAQHPELAIADLCYTANNGRDHFSHRVALVTKSVDQLRMQLASLSEGEAGAGVYRNYTPEHRATPKVAFLFTGQGSQYVKMGHKLYETHPLFRQTLDHCDEILRGHMGQSIVSVMFGAEGQGGRKAGLGWGDADTLAQTAFTQPALFALEYALATLWKSWGVEPSIVLGHSVGELVAACVAGVFSLEDGLKLIAARGRLMQALPQEGAMMAVMTNEQTVEQLIAPHQSEVSMAAVNGPRSVVLSGQSDVIEAMAARLAAKDIKTRPLTVSHAFHSPLMEPMLAEFAQVASEISYTTPRIPMVSNVTGTLATDAIATPDYWVQHVRAPVRFADGVSALHQSNVGVFLEIGPKPTLLGMMEQPSANGQEPPAAHYLPSLREASDDWRQMLSSLGELYMQGVVVDWESFDSGYRRHKVVLPTYPFQRQRYWIEWVPSSRIDNPPSGQQPTRVAARPADAQESVHTNGHVPSQQVQEPAQARQETSNGHFSLRTELLSGTAQIRREKMQRYLTQTISNALGIEATSLPQEQSLITLGLDSLMVMGVRQQIQRELGVNLPIENLVQGTSIAQLVDQVTTHLKQVEMSPSQPGVADALVAIQPEGSNPPFFCIHPIAGVIFPYYPLANCLGREQPVYGLQSIEVDGEPATSIAQMASTYIGAMRMVQPEGPYFLGGWSFGAFVAFEMARQLVQEGDAIGLLASFDQAAPSADKLTNTWQGVQFLVTTGIPNIWPYTREYLRSAKFQRSRNTQRQQYHWKAMNTLLRIMRANGQSILSYQAKPYEGSITLFQTTAQLQSTNADSAWGWDKLALGGVECIEVPGHHMNLLSEPYVNVVGEKLRIALRQAQQPLLWGQSPK